MTAATIAIKSKNKVDVLLLDRNPEAEVGKKTTLGWVCGDAVGEHHIKFLNEHLGVTYGKPEMENRVTAVYVYSPDLKVRVPFEGPGYVLDRPKFGRRLLEDALKSGVEFRGGVQALDLVEDEPFHCDIYLDQEKAPGGYLWLFPKSEDKVNIGLGIQQKRSSKPLSALLKDWLATDDRFKEMTPLS